MALEEARELGTKNANSTVVEFILYYFRKFDLDALLRTFRVIVPNTPTSMSTPNSAMASTGQ
ncbi:MAG TPA: hypothetical protein VNA15_09890 [Candidatus Angelobacter sp.]|nr:hypothetical protein [Candidatus Angelobacter sp.]